MRQDNKLEECDRHSGESCEYDFFHKLNHRQFRNLLLEAENQYGDILYFCDVRWLSRGAILARVYELRNEIATFLKNKNINAT